MYSAIECNYSSLHRTLGCLCQPVNNWKHTVTISSTPAVFLPQLTQEEINNFLPHTYSPPISDVDEFLPDSPYPSYIYPTTHKKDVHIINTSFDPWLDQNRKPRVPHDRGECWLDRITMKIGSSRQGHQEYWQSQIKGQEGTPFNELTNIYSYMIWYSQMSDLYVDVVK